MKWNGIVSQSGHISIAATFASANTVQAMSIGSGCREPVARMPHRFDRGVIAELLAQTPHRDLDDVRTWIEVVAPDLREQPLAADHLAGMERELPQQTEFPVREVGDFVTDPHLPA